MAPPLRRCRTKGQSRRFAYLENTRGRLYFLPPASPPSTAVCATLAPPLDRPSTLDSPAGHCRSLRPQPLTHLAQPTNGEHPLLYTFGTGD